ncbi:MAG: DUF1345 domain-containing protein [Reyranella sp.]|nr:DUF1345 domain-containing protein [Reyranella sp.]MDP3159107.1 DUF1345 domain-containing protein [Reyranella sp.]
MAQRSFRESRIYRFVTGRRRLLLSFAAGLVLFVLLPGWIRLPTRLIVAWDLTAMIYIAASLWMFVHSTVETCRSRAALYDEGDWIILLLVIASAAASFGAIFAELPALRQPEHSVTLALILTGATVALSWTFTHTVFTLHYANVYYRHDDDGPGGLDFPGDRQPDYRDFLYYSFVIGCAAQTGDVATTSVAMRYLSLVHGIVAFTFNTAILALTINVGASLLS